MKLFKKPNWLKPEITTIKYWVHLVILSVVVLTLLKFIFKQDMLTIKNVLISVPLLAVGDLIAHTLLKLD